MIEDRDRRPYPADADPSRVLEGDNILDALQADAARFLEQQRELGAQMSATLAERIAQMDSLGLVPQIPVIDYGPEDDEDDPTLSIFGFSVSDDQDDLSDPIGEFDDESGKDEDDSEEVKVPGFWVRHKDIDGDEDVTGVFLDTEGKLWIDSEFGESGLEIETFYKGDADEVPPEEYPVYFHEALMALEQAAEKGLGIASERNRMSAEEGVRLKKSRIDRDNAIYGGMEEFDEPVVNALMRSIHSLRDDVAKGSPIFEVELENMLRRLFEAQELMLNGGLEEILGGEELNFMAGAFINDIDPRIARKVRDLVYLMFGSDGDSLYILRRSFRVPYQTEPKNREILRVLALSNQRLRAIGVVPGVRALNTPTDYKTEDGRVIPANEIRDWLLSAPVEKDDTEALT